MQEALTDFKTIALPNAENAMSRRYLALITRWIPVGMRYYNDWPVRPNCGHFFGGVFWYGQDTAMPITALALAASSPEFDANLAGASADELREVALRGLRYLCFTHDTGPETCIRPQESWGRPEPAGTKWGERSQGFFRESQCGRTIAHLALTAALIADLVGDEEREMLANIADDWLGRFDGVAPRAGVYDNTQTEENAWTALGMVACLMLLPGHKHWQRWWEQAKLWMFRTVTLPQDSFNFAEFAGGKTVKELCGRTYTTLPDGTAENHGFVHPSYMASALVLGGIALNLLKVYQHEIPPHLFWHRQDTYDLLKRWCDTTGAPHSVQGMDWPYFAYQSQCFFHAAANLYLKDPDAALLEQYALKTIERSSLAHRGRMVPDETVKYCHGQQDPALMRERMVQLLAQAYLAHRTTGEGEKQPDPADFEKRMQGVYVYSHGGALLHRHARGQTSLSWRNRTMVLPAPRQGMKLIGPAEGSFLAKIRVKNRAESTQQVVLRIREANDHVSAILVQNLAQDSLQRRLFFASLPDGKCLLAERIIALEPVTVEQIEQGTLSVINDGYFGDRTDLRSQRTIFWENGERTFSGYVSDSNQFDEVVDLKGTPWVNVDDRFGLVFQGTGRAMYRNPHHFQVWHAIEDELVLSLQPEPQTFESNETVADLISLWCPEQSHQQTARQILTIHESSERRFVAEVDGWICAGNFTDQPVSLPVEVSVAAGRPFPISWGVTGTAQADLTLTLQLLGWEPTIVARQA